MPHSYTKKFFFIYLTKSLGFLTGLASVFLVVPAMASNPAIFGVYTVCISLTIFFSYADLGFIAAGQKYAAEFFAQIRVRRGGGNMPNFRLCLRLRTVRQHHKQHHPPAKNIGNCEFEPAHTTPQLSQNLHISRGKIC